MTLVIDIDSVAELCEKSIAGQHFADSETELKRQILTACYSAFLKHEPSSCLIASGKQEGVVASAVLDVAMFTSSYYMPSNNSHNIIHSYATRQPCVILSHYDKYLGLAREGVHLERYYEFLGAGDVYVAQLLHCINRLPRRYFQRKKLSVNDIIDLFPQHSKDLLEMAQEPFSDCYKEFKRGLLKEPYNPLPYSYRMPKTKEDANKILEELYVSAVE